MKVHVYLHHQVALGRLEEKLDELQRKGETMSAQMDALVARVAALHGVVDSAIEAIGTLREMLAEAQASAEPAEAIAKVIADLDEQGAALAEAIATPPPQPPGELPPVP